ncbi:peptidase S24/S26A/S26B/S26C [Rhodofomes roseus]|uniref:Peptidase S24/S26A/S26B/S26C n=2 Tax=Rhodofomes roseus TaxID=34475 RepID=A0ABQ8KGV9_9APHY|nr:peptidase S24/S26A/S26B/S26C [Rhodofomes roseus]KAH9837093.1 peptidase S24/S26A/S26B/S26C [Rhodofomes roseus]
MSGSRLANAARTFARRIRDNPDEVLNLATRVAKSSALATLHVVNAVCVAHLFANHVGWINMVDGPSMLPTMSVSGEWVLENKMIKPQNVQRGDLVTYLSPLDPSRIVCKRVVGLPGDIICVDPTGELAPSTEHVIIPRNHVWLSGDNAAMSRDSRVYGPVSMALIKGKLVARVWPLSRITVFRNNFDYID